MRKIESGVGLNAEDQAKLRSLVGVLEDARRRQYQHITDAVSAISNSPSASQLAVQQGIDPRVFGSGDVSSIVSQLKAHVRAALPANPRAAVATELSALSAAGVQTTNLFSAAAMNLLADAGNLLDIAKGFGLLRDAIAGGGLPSPEQSVVRIAFALNLSELAPAVEREYGIAATEVIRLMKRIDAAARSADVHNLAPVIASINDLFTALRTSRTFSLTDVLAERADLVSLKPLTIMASEANLTLHQDFSLAQTLSALAAYAPRDEAAAFARGTLKDRQQILLGYLDDPTVAALLKELPTDSPLPAQLAELKTTVNRIDPNNATTGIHAAALQMVTFLGELDRSSRAGSTARSVVGSIQDSSLGAALLRTFPHP